MTALTVKDTDTPTQMLRADLENAAVTIRNYRGRVKECDGLGEYGIGEDIHEILRQEQEHLTAQATALRIDVADVSATAHK